MHNVQVTPLIGLPQFNGWSQVVVNQDLTVTVALAISGQNAGNIGRDLVAQIKETSPASVQAFYRLLQDLKLDTEELGVVLSLSAAYVADSEISYATLRGTVILKRGEKVGKLVSSEEQLQLIQGKTQVDDVVVLATQAAQSFLGEIQQKATQGYSPDVIIKSLAPGIHKEPDTATLSIGFMVFEARPEPEPEPVIVEKPEIPDEEPLPSEPVKEKSPEPLKGTSPEPLFSPAVSHFEAGPPRELWRRSDKLPPVEVKPAGPFDEPPAPTNSFSPEPVSDSPREVPFVPSEAWDHQRLIKKPESVTPPKPVKPSVPLTVRLAPVIKVLSQLGQVLAQGVSALVKKVKKIKLPRREPLLITARSQTPPQFVTSSPLPQTPEPVTSRYSPFGHTPPVYLASGEKITRRRLIIVVILVLVCVGGGVAVWRQRQSQQVQAAQTELAPLLMDLSAAQTQMQTDIVGGRSKMLEVITQIEQLQTKYESQRAAKAAIGEALAKARQTYDSLSGKQELQQLAVFFDMASVQPGFLATEVTSDGQNLVAIDHEKSQLLILNLADKTTKLGTIADLPSKIALTLQQNILLVLGGGVKQLDISQDSPLLTEVIPEGDSNREGTFIGRFSDYIYVLNPSKRNIFRYLRNEEDVSDPIGWIKPGQTLPYESINSFTIDGDVWFTTTDGQILKFTSGEKQDFAITGLNTPFTQPLILETREEAANIYVLEPANKRVVVLSKTGQFLKEVNSPSLATASDIEVDEARGVILAVSGSLIFEMPI